jgi:hypothetical protein
VTVGLAAASVAGVLAVAMGVAVDRAQASDDGTGTGEVAGGGTTDDSTSGTGSGGSAGWPSILGGQGGQHASSGGS